MKEKSKESKVLHSLPQQFQLPLWVCAAVPPGLAALLATEWLLGAPYRLLQLHTLGVIIFSVLFGGAFFAEVGARRRRRKQ